MPGLMAQIGSILLPNLRMVSSSPCLPATRSRRMRITNAGLISTITSFCTKPLGILKNKVLIAAAVSSAIAKCSKPLTSVILYDRPFDIRDAFRPAGFPSTHCSAAVAAAMTLGFERGLSDSIFGMALLFACLIMFDAQGVRRQVGNHAKVMNKALMIPGDYGGAPLKESVGHTKVEVIGGAVLGFVVSVAIALVSSLVYLVI